jgi:MFS family permease
MTIAAYEAIFRNPSFRRFWLGFTISVLGDALTRVAFTWFVYDLTHSAAALGWLMLCYTGPIVVGGLLAGALLDRFDRRQVMLADNLIRGVAMLLPPLLYALDRLELWHIYAVAVLYGLLMMISLAGGPALIPSLVRADQLSTANALEMLSFTLGGVVGPVLAGLLIAWIGAPNVVILDALSYFGFAWLLTGVRLKPVGEPPAAAHRPVHLGHAVGLLWQNPILLSTTLMFLVFNIGGGMMAVWLPILTETLLGGGPQLYGILLGVLALGEVISALLAGSLTLPLPLGTRICLAQALAGTALLLILVTPAATTPAAWLVALSLALYGAFSAPLTIWAQTLRMGIIPERLRGRTFALLRMLMQSGNPIGGALAGGLLPLLGMTVMVGLSALLVGVPGLIGYGVKALRQAGGPLAGAAGAEDGLVEQAQIG